MGESIILSTKKKRYIATAQSRACSLFYSTFTASIENSYLRVKPSTMTFTVEFWGVWGKTSDKSDRICGAQTIGFCMTTMCHVIEYFLFVNFSLNAKCFASPPALFSRFHSSGLFLLPENKDKADWTPVWHCCRDPARIAEGFGFALKKCISESISKVAETLGSAYWCPRQLFWERRCVNLNKLSTIILTKPVRELFYTTSCVCDQMEKAQSVDCLLLASAVVNQGRNWWVEFIYEGITSSFAVYLSTPPIF